VGGQPPANVVNAIRVPSAARRVSSANHTSDQYDAQANFTVTASEEAVLTFYRTELSKLGWHVLSTSPATHQAGEEILAELPGTDGWYWELGAIVSPSTFGPSGADHTAFTLQLLQVPDAM
jgi:hypothetical protein